MVVGAVFVPRVHSRILKTLDPHIPILPRRSTSSYTDQANAACTKREAPRKVFGESHEH